MDIDKLFLEVQGLLGRTINNTPSSEEKELFRIAAAALMYISETGRTHSFEDYLQFGKEDPPYAVASFQTREEADTWLAKHPEPPHGTHVLIADEYYLVAHRRQPDIRSLVKLPAIDAYLEDLARRGPIVIAGKHYVAISHRLIHHRALYPLPPAQEPEQGPSPEDSPPRQG
jgi:hypothetical protein